MRYLRRVITIVIATAIFFSCQKETVNPPNRLQAVSSGKSVTLDIAKSVFNENQGLDIDGQNFSGFGDTENCLSLDPLWVMAEEIKTTGNVGIVTVPLSMPAGMAIHGRGAQLVFYPDSRC